MTRDKMIQRFHELDDQLNGRVPPKLDPCESGMRYTSPDVASLMVERQRLAFAIARSMPRAPETIAVVSPQSHRPSCPCAGCQRTVASHPHGPQPQRFAVG